MPALKRTPAEAYTELTTTLRETALLRSCGSLLGWDEQTYMPQRGAEHRSLQQSLLAGLSHARATSPRIAELLSEIEGSELVKDATSPAAVNVREARRDYTLATKLPQRLVEELSRICSLAQQAWITARKQNRWSEFLPWLEQVVALKREEAQALSDGKKKPYDALLDQYEPGLTADDVRRLFTPLRDALVPLIAEIRDSGREPRREILTRTYPVDQQREFSLMAARQIGFDFDAGRLDVTAHPFCSGIGPGDVRLTTRFDPQHFPGAFFGTLHEAGHGIYEQGLDPASFGLGMGAAVSLGIHESQSRLWENFVGRGRSFWRWCFPLAQAAFPEALADVSLDEFYFAINDVQPSFIRVEADEATYNLHILLRFELEEPLINGRLDPRDVPQVWNETFGTYFELTPPDDVQGCLQDIHWSFGGIGYFPTYTLGNMFAAQFYAAARKQIPALESEIASGEFSSLKRWLNENIHRRGMQYPSQKLVEIVTGETLSHEPLIRQLRAKYAELYGISG